MILKYIERTDYLQRLIDLQNTPDIKIITGIRRSGKSYFFKLIIEELQKQGIVQRIGSPKSGSWVVKK